MVGLQKAGGIAAWTQAAAYAVGFAAMATWLDPGDTSGWSAVQKLAFVLERKAQFQAWMAVIYVLAGGALVVMAVALHERFKSFASALTPVATAFALIWAGLLMASGMIAIVGLETVAALHARNAEQAAAAWSVIDAVQNGLGGGIEFVGGMWVLLVSVAALRVRASTKALHYLGIVLGVAGVLTLAPPLGDLAAVFGLGLIVWFVWTGIAMLQRSTQPALPGELAVHESQ